MTAAAELEPLGTLPNVTNFNYERAREKGAPCDLLSNQAQRSRELAEEEGGRGGQRPDGGESGTSAEMVTNMNTFGIRIWGNRIVGGVPVVGQRFVWLEATDGQAAASGGPGRTLRANPRWHKIVWPWKTDPDLLAKRSEAIEQLGKYGRLRIEHSKSERKDWLVRTFEGTPTDDILKRTLPFIPDLKRIEIDPERDLGPKVCRSYLD